MTTQRMSRAEKLDAETPESRNRVVDFLRAAAITVVVLGHWTLVAVDSDGGIQAHGVLNEARWTHPLTWIFQVMPIFFLVGGYSNALSWRSARRKNLGYGDWLRARLRRLCIPLVPLLLAWLAISVVALAAGASTATMELASKMALVPTWFLAAYLLVIAFAPACLVLWERWGWWSVAAGIALAGVVDAVSITLDAPLAGYPNYLLVWASFHQVGFAWLDGHLSGVRRRLVLLLCGAVGLGLLVGLGPYPVSMITAGGDAISNSSPTRVTMAFLGMMQAGFVLLLEGSLTALLRRPRVWLATVVVNLRIMTWFLWHLTALVGVSHLLLALGARDLLPTPLSGIWWATRPLWWLALLLVTGVLVLVFGRLETPRPDHRPAPPAWKPVTAAVLVCAGLAVMADAGMVGPNGVNWIWPALPLIGVFAFGVVSLRRNRLAEPEQQGNNR
ncbi:acyltransferase family protein [Tessaracoccus caeni]|uniref:acyltransferase family protein n=1 Tax=Tessaracoccus caeni TaxID=3031239 RepID=UPI0023DA2282|nr:acyltransferase [Tessaracoccus caeni]MDF1489613.1 acyltransferase [Tessaracoccus caeni]